MSEYGQGFFTGISILVAYIFQAWAWKENENKELVKLRKQKKWWDSLIKQAKEDVKNRKSNV